VNDLGIVAIVFKIKNFLNFVQYDVTYVDELRKKQNKKTTHQTKA